MQILQQPPKVVLCIDDEECVLECLLAFLGDMGYKVLTAASGAKGLALFNSHLVDVVILDYRMPEMNGHQVAAAIKRCQPNVPVIMLSGEVEVPSETLDVVDAFVQKSGRGCFATITKLVACLSAAIPSQLPPKISAPVTRTRL